MLLRLLLLITAFISSQIIHGKDFIWYNTKEAISYAISSNASPIVKMAVGGGYYTCETYGIEYSC